MTKIKERRLCLRSEKSYFYVYRNNFFNYRLNINFAIIVITGSDINVRTINNTNKSFNLSGISDFNITAPVSVKYINWVIDNVPIINCVTWLMSFPDTIIDGKNISVNPTNTAGAAAVASGIPNNLSINTTGIDIILKNGVNSATIKAKVPQAITSGKSAKYISITVLNPFIIISLNDGAVEALFIALFKPKLNRLVPDGTSSSFKWLTLLYVEDLYN